MLEGYKIMRALYGRGDGPFTYRELAEESGVNEKTVRTVLRRERLTEETGQQSTGRPGAPVKLLELVPEARAVLNQRLAAINNLALEPIQDSQPSTPDALLAAEEALLFADPVDPAQLAEESTLAWIGLDAGERARQSVEDEELDRHLAVVRALLGLCELEIGTLAGAGADEQTVGGARTLLADARAPELAPELLAALNSRVARSPVREQVDPALIDLSTVGVAAAMLWEVMGLLREQSVAIQIEEPMPASVAEEFHDLLITGTAASKHAGSRSDFRLVVLGAVDESDSVPVDSLGEKPLIVYDAYGRRSELAHLEQRSTPLLYLSELSQLGNAVSFARGLSRPAARDVAPIPTQQARQSA